MFPALHAVTTDAILSRPGFLELARRVMGVLGERGALHLRARLVTASLMHDLAVALLEAQESTGCWVVVNERVDIALATGARGAQLTSRSLTPAEARIVARDLPLGASVHSVVEAVAAAAAGADWVVAGHVYETASHPGVPGGGESLVREVAAATSIPCIAIGGIRAEHLPALRAAGAYGVAFIRGIWSANDAERAATDYVSAYESALDP
ncbi:MAG TPA: thiamine phosphate synthase [Gemmatimonadaceae bacterium]